MYGGSGSWPYRLIASSAVTPMKRTSRFPSGRTSTVSTQASGPELDPLAGLECRPRLAHGDPGVPGARDESAGPRRAHPTDRLAEQAGVADLGGVQNQEVARRR